VSQFFPVLACLPCFFILFYYRLNLNHSRLHTCAASYRKHQPLTSSYVCCVLSQTSTTHVFIRVLRPIAGSTRSFLIRPHRVLRTLRQIRHSPQPCHRLPPPFGGLALKLKEPTRRVVFERASVPALRHRFAPSGCDMQYEITVPSIIFLFRRQHRFPSWGRPRKESWV
jgi:hypothetical protein